MFAAFIITNHPQFFIALAVSFEIGLDASDDAADMIEVKRTKQRHNM